MKGLSYNIFKVYVYTLLLLIFLISAKDIFAYSPIPPIPSGNWQLVFDDEFDGSSLNTNKWTPYFYWATSTGSSGPLSWFTPNNVSVSGGMLHLTLRRETLNSKEYSSGVVSTGKASNAGFPSIKFQTCYGYYEIRSKVVGVKGVYTNYWLLDSQSTDRVEIDVYEVVGQSPTKIPITYWNFDYDNNTGRYKEYSNGTNFSQGFHVYGVYWGPEGLKFYVDNNLAWSLNEISSGNLISKKPMYLILDAGVGSSYFSPPDPDTPFPQNYDVDYVRVWENMNISACGGIGHNPPIDPPPTQIISPTTTPQAIPGDADGDGHVDGDDYNVWLSHYNQNVSGPSNGDFNNSGKVDGIDFVIWLNHYTG